MATATIANNVVNLTVNIPGGTLTLDMSLQRHHYRYCAGGAGAPKNSLMYATVADAAVITDCTEVGQQIEAILNKTNAKPQDLFGKNLTVKSGRIFLVDNSALNPKGYPNHFFVIGGASVWSDMSMAEYVAAAALRRVELAIQQRKDRGDKTNYYDAKTLNDLFNQPGGQTNPVIAAYVAANTALLAVPTVDAKMVQLSNNAPLVARARARF
jgi:hypothetical protein